MRGNTFGRFLTVTTFGESHGVALGAIVDGAPAGVALDAEAIQAELDRRRPGQSAVTTARGESDRVEILSGVFDGATLGSPICAVVRNHDARSEDYDPDYLRAGHADRVWEEKFGRRDWRGGGRASGRETIGRVIGGAVARAILPDSIRVRAFTRRVGSIEALAIPPDLDRARIDAHPTRCPDERAAEAIERDLIECKARGESRGGVAELWIDGAPIGLGEPVFRKAKSELCGALMSVGAVVGASIGDAEAATRSPGTSFHASFKEEAKRGLSPAAGGIQGGITNGERIVARALFKPPSTTGSRARSGRHDPCIIPRALPVLEAMALLVLADLWLAHKLDRIDRSRRGG